MLRFSLSQYRNMYSNTPNIKGYSHSLAHVHTHAHTHKVKHFYLLSVNHDVRNTWFLVSRATGSEHISFVLTELILIIISFGCFADDLILTNLAWIGSVSSLRNFVKFWLQTAAACDFTVTNTEGRRPALCVLIKVLLNLAKSTRAPVFQCFYVMFASFTVLTSIYNPYLTS